MQIFAVLLSMALGIGISAEALPSRTHWDLNDVSILYPLPQQNELDFLLKTEAQGRGGALLPLSVLSRIPLLSPFQKGHEQVETLRVVSVRIDPCFPGAGGSCRRQIRMVWQPLVPSPAWGVMTIDAALHSFYDLNDRDFASLITELAALKARAPISTLGQALDVHPVLKAEGLNGPFAQALQAIWLKYAGRDNLTKMTFMAVRGRSLLWSFGGWDVDTSGKMEHIRIARFDRGPDGSPNGVLTQVFVNQSEAGDDFVKSVIAPAPLSGESLGFLLRGAADIAEARDRDAILFALNSAHAIENPRSHSPETMDCVSCHIAEPVRAFAETRFPLLAQLSWNQGAVFQDSAFNLAHTTRIHTRNLRAFGYFEERPAISRRTISESAAVARILNSLR